MVTCPVVIEKFLKFKPTQERLRVRLAAILSMQLSNLSVKFHLCPVPQIVRSDTRWNWRWRPFFSSQCFWRNEVKKTVAKANLLNGKYTGMLILVTAIIPSVIFDIGMCSRDRQRRRGQNATQLHHLQTSCRQAERLCSVSWNDSDQQCTKATVIPSTTVKRCSAPFSALHP